MATKRKRGVPHSLNHPSQSSVAVPKSLREEIKLAEGFCCWLCNQKSQKIRRPLQICHVFPQALNREYQFLNHHRSNNTKLTNVHDKTNLIALCAICHLAFDQEEWAFFPANMTAWIEKLKAEPHLRSEYNTKRDVIYQRVLLQPDPKSKAYNDVHYRSAFVNTPMKLWTGEPGVLIIRNYLVFGAAIDKLNPKLVEILDNYRELRTLWLSVDSPCVLEDCKVCTELNTALKGDDGVDGDNEGDDDEQECGEGGASETENETDTDVVEDGTDGPQNEGDGNADSDGYADSDGNTDSDGDESRTSKLRDYDWMTTTPYDESIPYTHRYGYTWAGTTSSELMTIWQLNRQSSHTSGA